MHYPTPHWSQTSARLLNTCPRAWVSTYASADSLSVVSQSRPLDSRKSRTLDEALVHSMRTTWLERIQDQYHGKVWSPLYRQQRVKAHIEDELTVSAMDVPTQHLAMCSKNAFVQLLQLEQVGALRPLFLGQPRRWSYFDRRQGATLPHLHLFAAPDIAFFHQHKWTLIRLQFRASPRPSLSQQLEHMLMIHWAMNQPGFPTDMSAYRIKVISWHHHEWFEHEYQVNPTFCDQALALVEHDIQEMKWLQRVALADPSLNSIPLAKQERSCVGCSFRSSCPASEGLQKARKAQEVYVLELAQSSESKSAMTA